MTEGLDEVLANLTKLQVNNKKVARKAVSEAADMFKNTLKPLTPRGGFADEHLQDEINISGFKGANEGIISKDIGYSKDVGWRAHFPDDGTIYQPSQNFKERAINEATPKAQEIYVKRLKEGLNL